MPKISLFKKISHSKKPHQVASENNNAQQSNIEQNNTEQVPSPIQVIDSKSNWMGDLEALLDGRIRQMPLKSLVLMGSHDTGTYSMKSSNRTSPDLPPTVQKIGNLPIVSQCIKLWSKCQSWNIYQQLKAGIRYLDLRIAYNSSKHQFYICHGKYGAPFAEILLQLKTFFDEHPKEIVLLDFQHFFNMRNHEHASLIHQIQANIGAKALQPSVGVHVTIGELWEQNKQAIIIYAHEETVRDYPELLWYRDAHLSSPWFNKSKLKKLKKCLDEMMSDPQYPSTHNAEKFTVLQTILSPDVTMVFKSFLPFFPHSLNHVAKRFNQKMIHWFDDPKYQSANIIMVDAFDHISQKLFDITMALNIERINNFSSSQRITQSVQTQLSI